MRIDYSHRFLKQLAKVQPEIEKSFRNKLQLFAFNKFHPLLRNHSLVGKYKGFRSIDVTGDWRALFQDFEIGDENVVKFHAIGTHSELYK